MAAFVRGDVVVLPFPCSNLSTTKRRPALVVAALTGAVVILCPITSQVARNSDVVPVTAADFQTGNLDRLQD